MTMNDIKKNIEASINYFEKGNLTENGINLFRSLSYNTERQSSLDETTFKEFDEVYIKNNPNEITFDNEKALTSEWKYVNLLFQLSRQEILKQVSLFDTKKIDNKIIESYLFFTIELNDKDYSRSKLAQITREVNKLFLMPVMIIFKHGNCLSLSIINRRLHKKDESKDVLEKVTLIKDINIKKPHRGHIEILFDLSFDELYKRFEFKSFIELHNAWQKTLDSSELNKKFYRDIANWYFWAVSNVTFPDDEIKSKETTNSIGVIRLLTRIIFVWFLKEKDLIPEDIFDIKKLDKILEQAVSTLCTDESTYYKAILQNLFFATLNQEMNTSEKPENRKFRNDRQNYNITNLYRYEKYFKNKELFLELMSGIPFLNGGLFECLDKPDQENIKKIVRIDGFSDREDNQLYFPNYLFFAKEQLLDLSKIYDDKKKQKEKVRGLIEILNHYKFTIHENTPIEEEVALDPELLGKVFENLLASYNPETKNTARNQTGSFYTPREIVDYMVNESLIAYFQNVLSNKGFSEEKREEVKNKINHLLAYTEEDHKFTNSETEELIKAIDNCKIIDPACGSGAFPMGILHKMVFVLSKLDPNNKKWKQRQIDKISEIPDPSIKEKYLNDIEESFKNNELDYGRKLYLIENCIFGVDIQPIAVQIAKLRFFISLIVEQKTNNKMENLGIRPLPNLETKFVTADSLIGIEKPEQMSLLRNPDIDKKELELKRIRDNHFGARTPKTKNKYREEDEKLREEIAELLKKDGFDFDSTQRLAHWNPYDQNGKADFFDIEWMFGIKDGFDIVIGNPPYVQIQKFSGQKIQKDWEAQKYKTFSKTGDVYCLFYERGNNLLKNKGLLCFITSNKWMRTNYGESTRKYFAENTNPLKIIDFGGYKVFDSATVDTNILIFEKEKNQSKTIACAIQKDFKDDSNISEYVAKNSVILDEVSSESWIILSKEEYDIKKQIEKIGVPLKDWDISIYRGILTGFNEAFIIDGKKKDELIKEDPKNAEIIKPILRGRDIKKYKAEYADFWLISTLPALKIDIDEYPIVKHYLKSFGNKLNQTGEIYIDENGNKLNSRKKTVNKWFETQDPIAYYKEFEKEKIVWQRITQEPTFCFSEKGQLALDSMAFLSNFKSIEGKYIIAVLNSKTINFYVSKSVHQYGDTGYRLSNQYVEKIPIPKISPKEQKPFEIMVECILFAKEHGFESESQTFESVIDGMVYDLYFEDEMKKGDCYITDRIKEKVKPFKDNDTDKFKTEYIKALYNFCLNDKTVYRGLIYRRTINVVKIINGKKDE